jgi:hypothetical protein
VPIPFNDVDEVDAAEGLGSAAYLTLEPTLDHACCLGALLVISARGEPLEFGYNRVRVPDPFLWRQADLRRHVQRRLAASLLSVCSQQPRLLVCLADEVDLGLFERDLQLEVPVVRVSPPPAPLRRVDPQTGEVLEETELPAEVAWQPGPPGEASPERRLFEHLATHGLLLEPFERAARGLREVYGPSPCPSAR